MKKNLIAIGSSLGLIIDKPIAELYNLDKDSLVEITPKEDGLNIRFLEEKISPRAENDKVMKAAKKINKRYNKMMKNLAK
jgi:hypothetical protein